MCSEGGEAGGVRGVAELGFAGRFENFAFDDVFCLVTERFRNLDVGFVGGGGFGNEVYKSYSSGAAQRSSGVGATGAAG